MAAVAFPWPTAPSATRPCCHSRCIVVLPLLASEMPGTQSRAIHSVVEVDLFRAGFIPGSGPDCISFFKAAAPLASSELRLFGSTIKFFLVEGLLLLLLPVEVISISSGGFF